MTPKVVVLSGLVQKGELKLRDRARVQAAFKHWRDCDVTITIEKKHAIRSEAQNRFYWGVVVHLLSEHTGHTPDEIHEILKAKFLPKKLAVQDGNGEIIGEFVIGGTTTTLNKIEFGEYLVAIQQWAAERLGLDIPDPNEERLAS